MENKRIIGSIRLLITALVWGVAFVFQRTGMDHITPLTFMASRCVLASISLGIVLLIIRGPAKAFKFSKETIRGGVLCGIFMTFANNFQQIGMVSTTAGKAGFITAMYILLVPLGNFIIFKKRPPKVSVFAVLLGAVGLFFLCVNEEFTIVSGDLWVMACALTFTGHIICTDKFAGKADGVQMSFIQFVVCVVLGWILAFAFEEPSWNGIKEAWVSIAYCGIISAGLGYTLQILGQKYTEPATASLLMSFESVFAALSGAVLLHETMSGREAAGCVIMFVAILIVEVWQLLPARKKGKKNG